jgi:hypothetical protein
VQGHDDPNHPYVGVVMMTVWTVLLAPLFSYVTLRAGSAVAAGIAHGTLNATAGLSLMVVSGPELLVGLPAAAGMIVLAVANLILWWTTRQTLQQHWSGAYIADQALVPIGSTTGHEEPSSHGRSQE